VTDIDDEIIEIRQQVTEIIKKLDLLLLERETLAMMMVSGQALHTFLDDEPDLYRIRDIRAAYR